MKKILKILLIIFCIIISFDKLYARSVLEDIEDLFKDKKPEIHYCQEEWECGLEKWIESLKKIEDLETNRSFTTYAQDVIKYLLWFIYLVAVIIIIYAWANILTWAWDEEKMKKSKSMILYVAIWILVIFLAWPITDFILKILEATG